jgi:hypothetical protein
MAPIATSCGPSVRSVIRPNGCAQKAGLIPASWPTPLCHSAWVGLGGRVGYSLVNRAASSLDGLGRSDGANAGPVPAAPASGRRPLSPRKRLSPGAPQRRRRRTPPPEPSAAQTPAPGTQPRLIKQHTSRPSDCVLPALQEAIPSRHQKYQKQESTPQESPNTFSFSPAAVRAVHVMLRALDADRPSSGGGTLRANAWVWWAGRRERPTDKRRPGSSL